MRCAHVSCAARLALKDAHPLCLSHRTCSKRAPCDICTTWTPSEWDTLVSRQRKALGKRTLRSLRRESISSSGGEGVALKIAPLTPQGEEMAPVLSTAPLPDPQVLEIEDQGSKRGVRTLVGSLSSECGFPKASPRRSKSRKKSLGKALRLARKKQSLPPSGVVSTGVHSLPPLADFSESRGVESVHPTTVETASTSGCDVGASRLSPVPMGGTGEDFVGTKSGDRALSALAPTDVPFVGADLWGSGLRGPLAVPTARLAEASSGPSGLDLGEPVAFSRPTGQRSDPHRPPGTRELSGEATQAEFPYLAGPPGLARTQDPGLRTRDQGPGPREPSGIAMRAEFPALAGPPGLARDLAGPSGLARTQDPGFRTRELGPGTREPSCASVQACFPDPAGPRGPSGTLADPRGLARTQDPGLRTRDQGPGTRELSGTSVQALRYLASPPGLAGIRHSAPRIQDPSCTAVQAGFPDPANQPGLAGTLTGPPGLARAQDPGLWTQAQGPGSRDPGCGTQDSVQQNRAQAPCIRDPTSTSVQVDSQIPASYQVLAGTQAQARDPASTTVQAGVLGQGQVQGWPHGVYPMGWPFHLPTSATQSAPGQAATQSAPGQTATLAGASDPGDQTTPTWPTQVPYAWGPFGHMGWFPPGLGLPNPQGNTSQAVQEARFVTPRGAPNQGQGGDVFKHYSPLTQPPHRPPPVTSQPRLDESPMEWSSSGRSSSSEESASEEGNPVPLPWVGPSSGPTPQALPVADPGLQDTDTEGHGQVSTSECLTYEEALTNVKSFLASSRDPQGYLINMRAPQGSKRRRVTSLLAGPAEPVRQEGLPWTPDIRSSLFRLNLSLRGVPKGIQRRYAREGLPLPPADQSVMGRGTYPGKFTESAETATFRSFPNQLQGISEPVDLNLQPPDIPHRLWAAHPHPPTHVNLTWKAAADTEGLVRQQASILSHVSWWNYALQLRLKSLSDALAEREPALALASREASSWAEAGLTAATKALDSNQTFMAQLLLLRRDAVLEQTRLPRNRANQLRAAPLESPDLLGPEFDELTSTWSLEDEQARTLGGKATNSRANTARKAGGLKKRPFTPGTAAQAQGQPPRKKASASTSAKAQGGPPRSKSKKKHKKKPTPNTQRGGQPPRQGNR